MFLGIDCSTQIEVNKKSPHYYYNGKEVEPISFLHEHNGVKSMRIRLWLDPYDEEGRPYGGGTVDYPTFKKLAKKAIDDGYDILLDLHYSDFWCDPAKQMIPKAWQGLSLEDTAKKLYEYTKDVLEKAKKDDIPISYIQIGNEITNGMLWPLGLLGPRKEGRVRDNYDGLATFLKAGLQAAKEALPSVKTIIHLERSHDIATYNEYFEEIISRGCEFDIIGISYYPYWHGTFDMVFANVDNLKERFHKPIWIVETGYGFTMAPFVLDGGFANNLIGDGFFSTPDTYMPYPLTYEGQRDFIRNLIKLSAEHGVGAIYYWEPFWLPLPGLCWATKEGEEYVHETHKPTHNEWANQCLFDYEGKATPALDEYVIK